MEKEKKKKNKRVVLGKKKKKKKKDDNKCSVQREKGENAVSERQCDEDSVLNGFVHW